MMNKLNEDLTSMALTHEQFIERLSQMQEKFENERNMINKAKMEIFKSSILCLSLIMITKNYIIFYLGKVSSSIGFFVDTNYPIFRVQNK